MNRKNKKKLAIPVIAIIVLLAMTLGVLAASYEPGSENDPVVTLSYVESRLAEIVSDFQEKLDSVSVNDGNTSSPIETQTLESGFEAIMIPSGSFVYFGGNTQVILRSGAMTAIASPKGNGLADLTAGKDLKTGDAVQMNHLLLVPINDGRGVSVSIDSWMMIKGNYTLQ
ncbi:MAG: hypothetical protein JJE29_03900 [Peptostreptococcaceae bacterium]|nr:hypothetical protein [Peptostreptococcaceae bacterium]